MSIIGTLPNSLVNGTTADASQVMADLNFIVNQVNANANPSGTLTAPSGTRTLFNQSAAPLGWTSDTSAAFNDCSLRINSGTGGGTGGSIAWSSWNFGGTLNCNAVTLSIGNLPAHNHPASDSGHGHTTSPHNHGTGSGFSFWTATPGGGASTNFPGGANNINLEASTGNATVSVNTGNANITVGNTGSGTPFTPTITTPQVKYTDCIIGIKS